MHASTSQRGILYAAGGERYLQEATRSAQSVRAAMPDVTIAVMTDDPALAPDIFDLKLPLEPVTRSYEDKIVALSRSPFEQTLFLDTDTFVLEDCSELFVLLERFELAAAHDPWRIGPEVEACPLCFPELNTGVILTRRGPAVTAFMESWLRAHRARCQTDPRIGDQASFREQLYLSGLNFYCLASEYNFRTFGPNFAGANAAVKIIHGRHDNWEEFRDLLNRNLDFRTYYPSLFQYFSANHSRLGTGKGRQVQRMLEMLVRAAYRLRGKRYESDWARERAKLLNRER
ncbi:hypothetical protein H5P28_06840 [Ruficoccus amylovorans]|uniref:Nucleotide-diphospho-sugar transferase n=1 Tax=Ruficoccus amylovorans TaxID=1804625 RepID=A0A842HBY7_9BACT|nr:hypothetical protein [Ruficoccus amylovorans]MBC2593975.1 hypothetical protein [Ruficoccus amylovorans]